MYAFDEKINPNTNKTEFDFQYKDANGNPIPKFDELKSYNATLSRITSTNSQLAPGGQFGTYLSQINNLNDFKYKFDKRKLLNEHLGEGGFANIAAAEIAIKAKFKKIMVGEPLPSTPTPTPAQIADNLAERIAIANNYVGVMNDNLRTNPGLGVNIEISNGAELLQHIDIFLNKIIKVE